jgi:oligogalacturonide lyase
MCLALASTSAISPAQVPSPTQAIQAEGSPSDWIDRDTGHHVFRLTKEPDSKGLFFNDDAFTPDGKEMIYMVHDSVYVVDMNRYHVARQLISGSVRKIAMGKKWPVVYFMQAHDPILYSTNVYTGKTVPLMALPADATIMTVNADETLIAGTYTEAPSGTTKQQRDMAKARPPASPSEPPPAEPFQHVLFTLDLVTNVITPVFRSPLELSHVSFSPKDPTLLMYGYEGQPPTADRFWTMHTDGTMNKPVHRRTTNEDAASNPFWDTDGKTIWYDLQIPVGESFYLASDNLETGLRRWYPIERDFWSLHYNAAVDDSAFCGDGSDETQGPKSPNGRWIELFFPRKPSTSKNVSQNDPPATLDQTGFIQSGTFISHHLVNLSKADYTVAPNARFSPDHRFVIFTSNMFGPSYLFEVEVRHAPEPTKTMKP